MVMDPDIIQHLKASA